MIIVSPKSGDTMDLVFNLQATFLLGFLLNFASGLLWQISGHPIVLVGQESKVGSGESKMSKILTVACVQAVVHSYNIVKLQTCSALHSRVIATLRFSQLSKSIVT